MKKYLTCIVCPIGCSVEVELSEGQIESIKGNTCKRGAEYAASEVLNPVRTLTSTVRVRGGIKSLVPVKSSKPLPKGLLKKCMEAINICEVTAPVHIGDSIIENICDTGIDIIATSNVEQ